MDFRKTFDRIPDDFDRYRPRYCDELFAELIKAAKIDENSNVLEIGPGTGQATEPLLKTGCNYTAIELGENFTDFMKRKFSSYKNFHIVNDDFEKHDFAGKKFDLVYSAATIQWIPEQIAFPKCFDLLVPGGTLAMFMTRSDERSPNPTLYDKIGEAYKKYFVVQQHYTQRMEYNNVVNYGFVNFSYRDWKKTRTLTADEYVSYISTHCEHITLEEPHRSLFFGAVRDAIVAAGNKIVIEDTIPLYLVNKPE